MTKKTKNKNETTWFKQCHFASPSEGGELQHIAWIPEHLAVVGKKVYFGKKTDKPDRLWTVTSVSGRISGDYLSEHERDYLTQREASDI